jgi:hypothetical protein
MFSSKDKRAAATNRKDERNAALRAEVERLEALPVARLAAEVMVRGFGPGGVRSRRDAAYSAHVHDIAWKFTRDVGIDWPSRDDDLYSCLCEVVGEGLQVLEHQSLIWAYSVSEASNGGIRYTPTRRGRAALEDNAVEQALRGTGGEPA